VCVLPDARVEAACVKERKDPSTELGSPQQGGPRANVEQETYCLGDMWTEGMVVNIANIVFAEGMRLQSERGVSIGETPFPVFFVSVR